MSEIALELEGQQVEQVESNERDRKVRNVVSKGVLTGAVFVYSMSQGNSPDASAAYAGLALAGAEYGLPVATAYIGKQAEALRGLAGKAFEAVKTKQREIDAAFAEAARTDIQNARLDLALRLLPETLRVRPETEQEAQIRTEVSSLRGSGLELSDAAVERGVDIYAARANEEEPVSLEQALRVGMAVQEAIEKQTQVIGNNFEEAE